MVLARFNLSLALNSMGYLWVWCIVAILGLISGVMIASKNYRPGLLVNLLAVLTALLYIPVIVMFYTPYEIYFSLLVLLFGILPPVIYLLKSIYKKED